MLRKVAIGSGLLIGLYLLTNQKKGNVITDTVNGGVNFVKALQGR